MKSQLNILSRCSALICAIALSSLGSTLLAQEKKPSASRAAAVLNSMPRARSISEAVLSPDGTRVACIVDEKLSVIPVGGGAAHSVSVEGNLPVRDVAWSADGKRLAFIADLPGDSPTAQVWTAAPDGGAVVKHVELKGYVQNLRFSPDASKLAFLFIEGMPRVAGPLQPMTPLAGEINQKIYEQRIATIDLPTDHFGQVTPADVYVYEYDWSRDGKSWVASAAHGNGDANWWVARLYRVNSQNGEMREIYKPLLQIANPRVSPDGKNVAFIEGLMSDEGSTGGDIYIVPTAGGAAQNLTPNIKASPNALAWTEPDRITFSENVDGNSGFATVSLRGGAIVTIWTGEELAHPRGDAWATIKYPAGRTSTEASTATPGLIEKPITAIVRQSASAPPEVWAGPIGSWKQLTQMNADIKPAWGEMKNVNWMNGDTRVQGWLMLPKDFDPTKKYPLVVTVHGGPSAACVPGWGSRGMGALSAVGYFQLCPNPRGSYGQGEAFVQKNVKDFGGGDYQDILAGVDAMLREYPIDRKMTGIQR